MLLQHPVKAIKHQGFLLLSHVVWCNPPNQVSIFASAWGMYAMLKELVINLQAPTHVIFFLCH